MQMMNKLLSPLAALSALIVANMAQAQEELKIIGVPHQGGMGFQPAATDIAVDTHWLDHMILVVITAIVVLVVGLILWSALRFNHKSNPKPRRFSHYTPIEIAWTLIPVVILVVIGAFSLPVLFKQQIIPDGDVTIKVTGNQWFWSYEYPESGFGFDSFLLPREDLAANGFTEDLYLLATDAPVVIPTGKIIVMNVTGADVIHSWTIPAFGVKQDAVPGRIAQLWFEVEPGMEGIYFGQCSELCGKDHAFMPIMVKAVTPEEYEAWLKTAAEEYAGVPQTVQVAAAD